MTEADAGTKLYKFIRILARASGDGEETRKAYWHDLTCAYYPASGRYAWLDKTGDITKPLTKTQVIEMINAELGKGTP